MSTAKTVQVAKLSTGPWVTLAGNDASITLDGNELDTGIFGTSFNSSITGIISHSLSANAMLRKTAGYNARLKTIGASTVFTGEAMTLVSGKTYVITDKTKNFWDFNAPITVLAGGTAINASNILRIDHIVGKVTFVASYTPASPVTVTGKFFPTSEFGKVRSISLTQSADTIETGSFETIGSNGGFETYRATLKTVSADLEGFYNVDSDWYSTLLDRDELVLEIDWDGKGSTICRGIFRVMSDGQSGGIGGDETESVSLVLAVPEGVTPFGWYFGANSDAPESVKIIIESWENGGSIFARYLPEGVGKRGYQGEYVVTDCSLSTAVDAIGEMSIEGQGTGAIEAINV
jgi:hypothetical protein